MRLHRWKQYNVHIKAMVERIDFTPYDFTPYAEVKSILQYSLS